MSCLSLNNNRGLLTRKGDLLGKPRFSYENDNTSKMFQLRKTNRSPMGRFQKESQRKKRRFKRSHG